MTRARAYMSQKSRTISSTRSVSPSSRTSSIAPSLLSICGDGPDAELIRCPVAAKLKIEPSRVTRCLSGQLRQAAADRLLDWVSGIPCIQTCVTPPTYITARLAQFLSMLQRIRYLNLETIRGIGRVGSEVRCRSIRLPPTKPVYAQRSIRGVRDQGDAAGRGWAVSVSNQESTRVARTRRKRERVEQGVTHRDFAPV